MEAYKKFFSIIMVVFVLSSCVSRKKILKGDPCKASPFESDERFMLEQELAHKQASSVPSMIVDPTLSDIPIPLDTDYIPSGDESANPSCESNTNEQYMYSSQLERHFLHRFFQEQMEAFGWQKEGMINAFEDILIFSKAHKKVVISLRSSPGKKRKSFIVISVLKLP